MSDPSYEELRVWFKETKQKLDSREARLRELGVTDWETQASRGKTEGHHPDLPPHQGGRIPLRLARGDRP
jgi:hypothetical protein